MHRIHLASKYSAIGYEREWISTGKSQIVKDEATEKSNRVYQGELVYALNFPLKCLEYGQGCIY